MIRTKITEMFGIETPILMGGMTGVGYGELVAAVSNTGALGFITAHMYHRAHVPVWRCTACRDREDEVADRQAIRR